MIQKLNPIFVDEIPAEIKDGDWWISKMYKTSIHLCVCGCGKKTVLPFYMFEHIFHPMERVSVTESIGNYNFECKSHYYIKHNIVDPA